MDNLKFLLVSEGPTDLKFIKRLCSKMSAEIGKNIIIQELSPQMDATTNKYPPHGWTAVKRWCQNYKVPDTEPEQSTTNPFAIALANHSRRTNWKALLKISSAAGLIIQIDSDIAEQINDLPQSFSSSSLNRRDFCDAAVSNWINEDLDNNSSLIALISTYSLETWILATHDADDDIFEDLTQPFDYEGIRDVEQRLLTKGYRSTSRGSAGLRLDKNHNLYSGYADRVYANFMDVRARCSELDRFVSRIEEHS